MTRLRLAFVLLLALSATAVAAQEQSSPWFAVLSPGGDRIMGAVFKPEPYKPGMLAQVFSGLEPTQGVRDQKPPVISGFGFYGWKEGANLRVAVLVEHPVLQKGDRERYQQIATYTLTEGKPRVIEEMKKYGAAPYMLMIDTRRR